VHRETEAPHFETVLGDGGEVARFARISFGVTAQAKRASFPYPHSYRPSPAFYAAALAIGNCFTRASLNLSSSRITGQARSIRGRAARNGRKTGTRGVVVEAFPGRE